MGSIGLGGRFEFLIPSAIRLFESDHRELARSPVPPCSGAHTAWLRLATAGELRWSLKVFMTTRLPPTGGYGIRAVHRTSFSSQGALACA